MKDGIDLRLARDNVYKRKQDMRAMLLDPAHTLSLNHWIDSTTEMPMSLRHVITSVQSGTSGRSFYLAGHAHFSYDEFREILRVSLWINRGSGEKRLGASLVAEVLFAPRLADECYLGREELTFRCLCQEGFPE